MAISEGKIGGGNFASILSDPSIILLLATNLAVIALAVLQNWSLLTVMLIYWCQSVTIGIFTFLKILTLKNYGSGETVFVNGKPIQGTGAFGLAKLFMAGFFAVHYGIFHFVYFIFIMAFNFMPPMLATGPAQGIDFLSVLISGAIFFANHLFSFLYNYKRDINCSHGFSDIKDTFFAPYARIIPMHLTIIFGFGLAMVFPGSVLPLLLFMLLKTGADLAMHANKHHEGYVPAAT